MKKTSLLVATLFLTGYLYTAVAQDKKPDKKDTTTVGQDLKNAGKSTGKAVKKSAKAVGNKTAEIGAKGAATVKDKALKNRKGPDGQTVYVNKYDQKYYIDKKGKRVYMDD